MGLGSRTTPTSPASGADAISPTRTRVWRSNPEVRRAAGRTPYGLVKAGLRRRDRAARRPAAEDAAVSSQGATGGINSRLTIACETP